MRSTAAITILSLLTAAATMAQEEQTDQPKDVIPDEKVDTNGRDKFGWIVGCSVPIAMVAFGATLWIFVLLSNCHRHEGSEKSDYSLDASVTDSEESDDTADLEEGEHTKEKKDNKKKHGSCKSKQRRSKSSTKKTMRKDFMSCGDSKSKSSRAVSAPVTEESVVSKTTSPPYVASTPTPLEEVTNRSAHERSVSSIVQNSKLLTVPKATGHKSAVIVDKENFTTLAKVFLGDNDTNQFVSSVLAHQGTVEYDSDCSDYSGSALIIYDDDHSCNSDALGGALPTLRVPPTANRGVGVRLADSACDELAWDEFQQGAASEDEHQVTRRESHLTTSTLPTNGLMSKNLRPIRRTEWV
jgi:hypothetical protein